MKNEYGCDDLEWLLERSDRPGTVHVETRGRTFHVPTARFDNRTDLTTFLREDKDSWNPDKLTDLEAGLSQTFERLWKAYSANHQ